MPCRNLQFTYSLRTDAETELCFILIALIPTSCGRLRPPGGCGERAPLSLPDVFLLGVLRDWDALAVGLELVLDDLSVRVVLHAESVVQDAGDVIVPEEEGGRV